MSALLEIQRRIDAATVRVKALEHALIEHPGFPSIAANLESAVRIQRQLESQFFDVAAESGMEVCRYRAFNDIEDTKTAPALAAIAEFQRLVSVVYAGKK